MGTLAAAGTSNSKTATEPPDASPSSRNRTANCPILISSLGLVAMRTPLFSVSLTLMRPSFRCDQRPAYSRPYGADPVPTPQSHSPIRRDRRIGMHEGGCLLTYILG